MSMLSLQKLRIRLRLSNIYKFGCLIYTGLGFICMNPPYTKYFQIAPNCKYLMAG